MSNISPLGRADLARANDVSTARNAYDQQSNTAAAKRHSIASKPGDRVSISEEARALSTTVESEDVSFSRLALKAVQPLSAQRLGEITTRLQQGFYSSPDVVQSIAGRVADDIAATVI